jgi:hypothetical protein
MKNAQASSACSHADWQAVTLVPWHALAGRQQWRQPWRQQADVLGLAGAESACTVQESYLDEESIRHFRQHKQREEEEQRHRQEEQASTGAVSDEVCLHAPCACVYQGVNLNLPSVCMHSGG